MINYLNRARQRTISITHDGGVTNPADYVIIGPTIANDPVLANDYFDGKKSVLIVGMQLVNRHATDSLTYDILSGGVSIFGIVKTLFAGTSVQINGITITEMLGLMYRDGQGNYMMIVDAENDLTLRITSASAIHAASLHVQFLIEEV